jgi:hypothetical protein
LQPQSFTKKSSKYGEHVSLLEQRLCLQSRPMPSKKLNLVWPSVWLIQEKDKIRAIRMARPLCLWLVDTDCSYLQS